MSYRLRCVHWVQPPRAPRAVGQPAVKVLLFVESSGNEDLLDSMERSKD